MNGRIKGNYISNFNLVKIYLLLFSIFLVSVICFLIRLFPFDSFYFSVVFVVFYVYMIYVIWRITEKRVTLFFLFYLTYGLFIGGRFFSIALGYEEKVFEPTNFYDYFVPYERQVDILDYVFGFMLLSVCGYYWGYRCNDKKVFDISFSPGRINRINRILSSFFPVIAVMLLMGLAKSFLFAIDGGYLALYLGQSGDYAGASIWLTLLPVSWGVSMTYGNRSNKIKYLSLYVVQAFILILMGGRGRFGALMLILLWLYSTRHRITLKKLLLICLSFIVILLLVFTFSIRAIEHGGGMPVDLVKSVSSFFYAQGISLMVFDTSRLIEGYPVVPYFQSLFPGVAVAYSVLTGNALAAKEVAFDSYMCLELNSSLFARGYGLGWTLMSDLYLFGGRLFGGYLLLAGLFGFVVGKLESKAKISGFYRYLSFVIAMQFLLLPRAGLNTVCPLVVYAIVIFYLFFNTSLFPKHDPYSSHYRFLS